jgi:hypothetical protein
VWQAAKKACFSSEDWGDMFLEVSIDFQRTTQRYIPEDGTNSS